MEMGEEGLIKQIIYDIDLTIRNLNEFERMHDEDLKQITSYMNGNEGVENNYKQAISRDYTGTRLFKPFYNSLESLKKIVQDYSSSITSKNAIRGIITLSNVTGLLDVLELRLKLINTSQLAIPSIGTAISKVSTLISNLKAILNGISTNLLVLVSQYLSLKEWSITGSFSTSPIAQVFGISGSGEIQLTFKT